MSGKLNGEVFWFLSPLSLSQLSQPDRKKQFITSLLSKSYAITNVFQENQ